MVEVQQHQNLKERKHKLIIIGAGGHGNVCYEIALMMNKWSEVLFLDDNFDLNNSSKLIVGKIDDYELYLETSDYFVAIGDNFLRKSIYDKIISKNGSFANLIHPTSYISDSAELGKGNVVMPNSIINSNVVIADCCIINTGSIIEHDCIIDSFVHIAPNATLAGSVRVGKLSFIGMSSAILPSIFIEEKVIIGALTVVLKSVKKEQKVIGKN